MQKRLIKMFRKKQKFVREAENYSVLKRIHEKIKTSRMKVNHWKTPEIMELIGRARKEIGYSDKTVDIDIINSLYSASRSSS